MCGPAASCVRATTGPPTAFLHELCHRSRILRNLPFRGLQSPLRTTLCPLVYQAPHHYPLCLVGWVGPVADDALGFL